MGPYAETNTALPGAEHKKEEGLWHLCYIKLTELLGTKGSHSKNLSCQGLLGQ